MTTDHLKPLLGNVRDLHMLFLVGEQLATGKAPHEVVEIVRMAALTKPNGGIRGIWRCGSKIGVEDHCPASERSA